MEAFGTLVREMDSAELKSVYSTMCEKGSGSTSTWTSLWRIGIYTPVNPKILNTLPLSELAILREQRPEHGTSACVQALIENLPAALARDIEHREDAHFEGLAHLPQHLAFELQLDVHLEDAEHARYLQRPS
ncbi:hypothetical protein NUW58_g8145 [Xylaria curta]|uniref:Uncharacterized protein n=1 Tax=Xylaria curta TaxID=42375 RepID=A0ACC1NBP2_9PEZI|nr:hypothetical protein NUW58_g8145 [Xylaria curta]